MVCEHEWRPTTVEHFDECARCGSYHNRDAPPSSEVYGPDYWDGHPDRSSMEDQVFNVETHTEGGVTKNAYVLGLIDCRAHEQVIEVGCAPGSLLRRLKCEAEFGIVLGIEYRAEYAHQVRGLTGPDVGVWFGEFPTVTKCLNGGATDLLIALDVFEHSHEPEAFLAECARLLKPGGQMILMMPMALPLAHMEPRMFHPTEHVFLPTTLWLSRALTEAGFGRHDWGRWCNGHETVSAWRAAA